MKLEKECKIEELTICHSDIKNGNSAQFNCFIYLKNDKEENILTKIYNSFKIKLTLEVEETILDEVERKYLSEVIRPFRNRVDYIKKIGVTGGERIIMKIKGSFEYLNLPFFKKGSMYKGMKAETKYTLDDLNL